MVGCWWCTYQNIYQQLDVVRWFPIVPDFSKHLDPVGLIVCVRQTMHITSTIGTCIVLLFLLGVTILGCCAFPLAFLAFLAFLYFPAPFVGLIHTILRKVSFLTAHLTDIILREYAQIHWHWTSPSRSRHGHCPYLSCHQCVCVVHSWVQEQVFTSPLCCTQSCICFSQAVNTCVTSQPGMSHLGNRIACSILRNLQGTFWFPARHHPTPHLHSMAQRALLHDVQRLSIRQRAQDVVQIRAVCCLTRSHRILPDLNLLLIADTISSPSLGAIAAQYALILNDRVVHRSLPSCSPEYTFGFVKSSVSTRLKHARTSVCAVAARCAVNSCTIAYCCAVRNAVSSLNCRTSSAVAMTLPHATRINRFASRTLQWDINHQPQPQVRTNAPQPCTNSWWKVTVRWVQTTRWLLNLGVPSWSGCISNNNDWVSFTRYAQEIPLSTSVKPEVTAVLTHQLWQRRRVVRTCRLDHETNQTNREAYTRKHEKRPDARVSSTRQRSTNSLQSPQACSHGWAQTMGSGCRHESRHLWFPCGSDGFNSQQISLFYFLIWNDIDRIMVDCRSCTQPTKY